MAYNCIKLVNSVPCNHQANGWRDRPTERWLRGLVMIPSSPDLCCECSKCCCPNGIPEDDFTQLALTTTDKQKAKPYLKVRILFSICDTVKLFGSQLSMTRLPKFCAPQLRSFRSQIFCFQVVQGPNLNVQTSNNPPVKWMHIYLWWYSNESSECRSRKIDYSISWG